MWRRVWRLWPRLLRRGRVLEGPSHSAGGAPPLPRHSRREGRERRRRCDRVGGQRGDGCRGERCRRRGDTRRERRRGRAAEAASERLEVSYQLGGFLEQRTRQCARMRAEGARLPRQRICARGHVLPCHRRVITPRRRRRLWRRRALRSSRCCRATVVADIVAATVIAVLLTSTVVAAAVIVVTAAVFVGRNRRCCRGRGRDRHRDR